MIKEEPRLAIKDLFGILFIAFGFILFLILLHVLSIETEGNLHSVLNTTFQVALRIFMSLFILGFALGLIHFLKWIVWYTSTPEWMRKEKKQK